MAKTPQEVIAQITEKAQKFAKTHAVESAKNFYIVGKRDAASTILSMVRSDGIDALIDVADELLKHNPNHEHAKWIIENQETWKSKTS